MRALLLAAGLSLLPLAELIGVDVPPQAFLPTPAGDNVTFTLSANARVNGKPDVRADSGSDAHVDSGPDGHAEGKPDVHADGKPDVHADSKPDMQAGDKPTPAPVPVPLPPVRKPVVVRTRHEICTTLAKAAHNNDLPIPFFIRLLFQESRFRAGAVSPAGAQGIAQFMPATSADVGLDNPFDPLQAIPASARLLRKLFDQFGNLGLAAAAYNAGPKRVLDWLAKKAEMPAETVGYVKTVTGRPVETWRASAAGGTTGSLPRQVPCRETVPLRLMPLPPARPVLVAATKTKKRAHADKHAHHAAASGKVAEAKPAKSAAHASRRKKERTEQFAARRRSAKAR